MKHAAEYQVYVERQRAYGFAPLAYLVWLSWHLNTPLPELRDRQAAGENL